MGRKKKNSTPELDLHGVKHADVEAMVENFVLVRTPPIKIVTGNSKVMKEIVTKTLQKHGYNLSDFFPACIMVL
jgi:hypothetical protein